ncbi:MAG TPA: hypothetical protein DEB40_11565 [Elusimicrobia bacterium]|nr:hypothetical protein [Elusimicrobiota bacterium]HBT62371.1 hypothetical protein [Elusimicrobiota bacterium]
MSHKLLVVDDEPFIVETFMRYFQRQGYTVTGLGSAEEAISLVEKEKFDLIFLDNILPGMSGMRAIQELARRSNARVLMMTGHFDQELKKDALLMGAVDFLPKPLEFDRLECRVRELLGNAKSRG